MADLTTQSVLRDTGSEYVATLERNYNALLNALGDFATAVAASALVADVIAAGAALETALEANVSVVQGQPNIPPAPRFPSV